MPPVFETYHALCMSIQGGIMARALLKADLHTHAADDPHDTLGYSAEELIDAAADAGMDVLAITLHEAMIRSEWLTAYAEARNVLLIPGIELIVEGKHIVVLNPDADQAACTRFDELRALGRRDAAMIAPHPFYPAPVCLGRKFFEHIDLFDAIEYCTMYTRTTNFNLPARWAARRYGLPLVGTSDSHSLPYVSSTHSVLDAERSVPGVIDAILQGRVSVVTRPRTHRQVVRFGARSAWDLAHGWWRKAG